MRPTEYMKEITSRDTERWLAVRLEGRETLSFAGVGAYSRRFRILLSEGFLEEEAKWLATGRISKIEIDEEAKRLATGGIYKGTPIRAFRASRRRAWRSYCNAKRREGWSPEKLWRHWRVKQLKKYHENDWYMKISGDIDPYQQMEDVKRQYNLQDSPRPRGKRKLLSDYSGIVARTQADPRYSGKGRDWKLKHL